MFSFCLFVFLFLNVKLLHLQSNSSVYLWFGHDSSPFPPSCVMHPLNSELLLCPGVFLSLYTESAIGCALHGALFLAVPWQRACSVQHSSRPLCSASGFDHWITNILQLGIRQGQTWTQKPNRMFQFPREFAWCFTWWSPMKRHSKPWKRCLIM